MAEHIERFAPSPTGPLHLGHAFSALTAWDRAVANNGKFLLRIEDIDQSRCRPEWEEAIFDDLRWLGVRWEEPVMRQSERLLEYRKSLQHLWLIGLLYPCTCTRRDIELSGGAPQEGVNSSLYPGTCRRRHPRSGTMPENVSLRIDHPDAPDIVLARRDIGTSYHLAVVVDDAAQRVTHVTRGQDLEDSTKIHVLLQNLLGLPTPIYHHHRLIRDENGKRLAKRDDARALAKYRAEGVTPEDIRRMVGLP